MASSGSPLRPGPRCWCSGLSGYLSISPVEHVAHETPTSRYASGATSDEFTQWFLPVTRLHNVLPDPEDDARQGYSPVRRVVHQAASQQKWIANPDWAEGWMNRTNEF